MHCAKTWRTGTSKWRNIVTRILLTKLLYICRKQVVRKILKGHYSFKARTWKYVSEEAKMFVKQCLSYTANERPTADEALKLAWMQKDFDNLAPELDSMDMVQAALQNFASYGTLKKLALMVIAHKSTSEEIGFLRKLFTKYDTLKNGVITLPEFKAALVDYDYSEIEMDNMFAGIVSKTETTLACEIVSERLTFCFWNNTFTGRGWNRRSEV